jgi:hypothetical protein
MTKVMKWEVCISYAPPKLRMGTSSDAVGAVAITVIVHRGPSASGRTFVLDFTVDPTYTVRLF